jgi:hypothetical protein
VERDLASGQERELFRRKVMSPQSFSISPDGRYLAVIAGDDKDAALTLIPLSGGETRDILRGTKAGFVSSNVLYTAWTADSQHVLLTWEKEVRAIPVSGGPTKQIEIGIEKMRGLRVQPGGNKLAFFTAGSNPDEIWTLENFLADDKAKK